MIISEAIVGKAHKNSSKDDIILYNEDGSYYTKPDYIRPPRGFDCMYSHPGKKIWVIPSVQRVFPLYWIQFR